MAGLSQCEFEVIPANKEQYYRLELKGTEREREREREERERERERGREGGGGE